MKQRRNLFILIGSSVAIFLLLWMLFFRDAGKNYSWKEHYKGESDDPYGTLFLRQLLSDYTQEGTVIDLTNPPKEVLPSENEEASYVFVGEAMFMDSLDMASLLAFVGAGNTAFISSKTIPADLMFHLYYYECDDAYWSDYDFLTSEDIELEINDLHSVYLPHLRRSDTTAYSWNFIGKEYFCNSSNQFFALGTLNEEFTNFARVSYLEGNVYLHTTPIALSNFSLLEEERLAYAEQLFSRLPSGELYWDEFSKVPEAVGRSMNNNYGPPNQSISAESPLRYVLNQPPLAWAWYLLLALGLLYLLFRARRRQRIIPVAEPNTNTSLEFISTIGRLYFFQQNHKQLCLQKTRLFLSFLRNRYGLQWRSLEKENLTELEVLSGISMERLEKVQILSSNLERATVVSENTLTEYHRMLDYFYRHCR